MREMLLVGLLIGLVAGTLTFTGNVPQDFPASQTNITTSGNFNAGLFQIYLLFDGVDVGAPPGWPYVTNGAVSGWDFEDIRFQYDYTLDNLNIGINFYGIASDADNDGDPAHTSAELQARGGQDNPNFAQSESCAIIFDWGNTSSNVPDGVFDFVIGYPNTIPGDSDRYPNNANAFPAGSSCAQNLDTSCFNIYLADQTNLMDNPGARFLYKASDPTIQLATSMNLLQDHNAPTSKTKPHLEWTIQQTNAIRTAAGFPTIDQKGVIPFQIAFQVFCGSFQDDGIGEDYFPNIGNYAILNFPCQVFDACDVCGGDGSSCADCAGVPNGPNKYDVCDVCGGTGSSCRDCKGIANGPNVYDVCDVCGGNGSECLDCKGVANGPNVYDACDVCSGNGSTCLDCKGIANGPNKYDACDICGGNGSTCVDCKGVANGANVYDVCDVCGGNGRSCLDCKGVANGPNKYDVCDVCAGTGSTCLDCKGVANGPNKYDVCDVCDGNGKSCLDCAGTPFGTKSYDVCGVCGGDGNECKDCKGVVLGTNTYDVCGVCDGDGSSCKPLDCTTASELSDAVHAGLPQTMNALKRRLQNLKHHRDVVHFKARRLHDHCGHRERSHSRLESSHDDDDDDHHSREHRYRGHKERHRHHEWVEHHDDDEDRHSHRRDHSDRHHSDRHSDRHDSDRHHSDRHSDRHDSDRHSDRHHSDRHDSDRHSDRHDSDRHSDRHHSDRHDSDRHSDRHHSDRSHDDDDRREYHSDHDDDDDSEYYSRHYSDDDGGHIDVVTDEAIFVEGRKRFVEEHSDRHHHHDDDDDDRRHHDHHDGEWANNGTNGAGYGKTSNNGTWHQKEDVAALIANITAWANYSTQGAQWTAERIQDEVGEPPIIVNASAPANTLIDWQHQREHRRWHRHNFTVRGYAYKPAKGDRESSITSHVGHRRVHVPENSWKCEQRRGWFVQEEELTRRAIVEVWLAIKEREIHPCGPESWNSFSSSSDDDDDDDDDRSFHSHSAHHDHLDDDDDHPRFEDEDDDGWSVASDDESNYGSSSSSSDK